jgi:hypothetical protein
MTDHLIASLDWLHCHFQFKIFQKRIQSKILLSVSVLLVATNSFSLGLIPFLFLLSRKPNALQAQHRKIYFSAHNVGHNQAKTCVCVARRLHYCAREIHSS